MQVWQRMMIRLARSRAVDGFVQDWTPLAGFSRRFVGGPDAAAGAARARELAAAGVTASLFFLGEYEEAPEVVERTVAELAGVIPNLARAGLDLHLSVDPTQVGAMRSWEYCRSNLERLASLLAAAQSGRRKVLMLDMEDSSVTQPTLDAYYALRARSLPAAVTVQAYLRRSADDLGRLIAAGATVRLVKGAFAEGPEAAFQTRSEIDERFMALAEMLLGREAREAGVYPAFGTHDARMVRHARRLAEANGWSRDDWEVEMLYGVRPDMQTELVRQGCPLRLYLPFGERWWPYSVRRIGENPKNLLFVLRSLLGRG